MAASGKIRVGVVGLNPNRGFASIAHIPALQALPGYEIVAVCASRQESAEATARHYGIPHAFADAGKLARHPDVDLVTVTVKVPDHLVPVMAAIDAGKHVYCEWPLGCDTAEAARMRDAAAGKGVRHAVGLQGQTSPAINYVKDLVAQGYVGPVRSATLIGCAANWGATIDRAYQADFASGANLMTITGGHQIDALCHCLGEFRELNAFAVSQRDHIPLESTGEMVAKNVPDQLVVSGIVGDGAVVSFQIRGGMARGTEFLFEIHGDAGDLVVSATSRASMQRQELNVQGAQGKGTPLAPLPVPASYRHVPVGTPEGSPYNVAQLYAKFADSIGNGSAMSPGFDAAVRRHHLLDAIVRASQSGQKQVL
ncbi:MAG TPA: Gfo/Idh/MocA family oxidoreductase [Stellaceae bacterium]|jgi:predicted dehydrogenase|nr:Gfo/Idh/MocA family oxidoreductase [Stellaceae bacterium]